MTRWEDRRLRLSWQTCVAHVEENMQPRRPRAMTAEAAVFRFVIAATSI
jgi:hypothetical protein